MGTIIGNVLISYDVDKSHSQVKTALESLGYYDHFQNPNNPKTYHLPNTTLWHKNKTSNQAMTNMRKVCTDLGVTLEKAVAVKASEFVGL